MVVEVGTPLKLADGTVIDPATGKPVKHRLVTVPSNTEARQKELSVRRRLVDLPLPPRQMNLVAVIVMYTLYGLSDSDIAQAVGIDETQVAAVKETEAYTLLGDQATAALVKSQADEVRSLISEHAKSAATRIVNLLDAENEGIQLKAAQDILDRDGHRPVDVVEHRHSMSGGLEIVMVHRKDDKVIPTIDLGEGGNHVTGAAN